MLTGKGAKAFLCAGVFAAGSFAASGSAQAQSNAEMMRIIQQLQQQVQQLQDQVQTNTANAEEAKEQAAAAQETAKSSGGMEYKWGPSMTFKSADGKFEMHVRGRIMVDFGYVNDNIDFQDRFATEFRRVRLGIEGKAWKDIKYKFEIDFADNEVDIADAYIQYRGWKPVRITIGQFKETVSLDEQTSSRQITVIERAGFTDAFGFSRRIGVGMDAEFGDFGIAVGLFGGDDLSENEDSEGYAFTGRAWWEPKIGEDAVLHVGGSFRYRNLDNDLNDGEPRYRQRPVSHVSERYLNTGNLDNIKSDVFYGAELAGSFGPFFAAGEIGFLEVSVEDGFEALYNGEDNISFMGAYGEIGWFITGETRPLSGGDWGRPKVNNPVFEGGFGAWAIAFRLDYLDLNDFNAGVVGGEQLSYIFNISWYLNRHTRFILAYAHNDISDGICPVTVSCGFGAAEVDPITGNAKVDTVMGRFQVDW